MADRRPETDAVQRVRILARARQAGDEAASNEFSVPRSTIRVWRLREKQGPVRMPDVETMRSARPSRRASNARAKVDLAGDELSVDDLRRSARSARRVMEKAVRELNRTLELSRNPRDVAIAYGILSDKASDLAGLIMALDESDARVSAAQGVLMVEVIRAVFVACGVPVTGAVGAAVSEALRGAQASGGVIKVSPDVAEAAAREVREALGRLQLSEPVGSDPVEEIDGQVDEVLEAASEKEPADAEVVEEPLPDGWLSLHHNDPVAARRAYEGFKVEQRDREQRKHDSPDRWRVDPGGSRGSAYHEVFRAPSGGM